MTAAEWIQLMQEEAPLFAEPVTEEPQAKINASCSIIVPSTINVTEEATEEDIAAVLHDVRHSMSVLFGGCMTFHNIDGGWIGSSGIYVTEPCYLVKSNCTLAQQAEHRDNVKAIASAVKHVLRQESVMVLFDVGEEAEFI